MSYIGVSPSTAAFPFDQFSGNGTTTAFTMSYAPASTTSMVVCISGVVQNPNTYGISGLTLTFSAAPPTGTNNIAVLYLGIPATSVTTPGNTAFFSSTSFTATAGQTTFTPSGSYQVGFLNVIRNGSQLAPADYTATNGTTVVLNNACVAGDIVVIQVYTLTSLTNALPSTGGTVTGATTFNSTVSINGANGSGYTGYKNRIINGRMEIDQRNNGAAVSVTDSNNYFCVDRWLGTGTAASGVFSLQRSSSTPPSNFINFMRATVTTIDSSLAAGDFYGISQRIEGFNISDLGFGTASASTVTLSFWVRSSLTGTFTGSLNASPASSASYVFSYTINSANTWEQKTITVAGSTIGTFSTSNTLGLSLWFSLALGSSYTGTAGTWTASAIFGVSSATNFMATNGATFDITGVQLERGSNATSFEFRDYGRELQMCQRYYFRITPGATTKPLTQAGWVVSGNSCLAFTKFPVTMRTAPSALEQSGTANQYGVVNLTTIYQCNAVPTYTNSTTESAFTSFTTASAITAGQGGAGYTDATNGATAYLGWSAEL